MSQVLLKIQEAAEQLRISTPRAYELVRLGIIPAVRVGRQVRVNPEKLREFIDQGGRALPGGWRREVR